MKVQRLKAFSFRKKYFEMFVLSIAHAIAKLPDMQMMRERNKNIIPVLSNSRYGNICLHKIVKTGEKRNSGNVLRPIKRAPLCSFPFMYG